jgi:hypothetical protein
MLLATRTCTFAWEVHARVAKRQAYFMRQSTPAPEQAFLKRGHQLVSWDLSVFQIYEPNEASYTIPRF